MTALEEERDTLVRSLRDLEAEREAGDLTTEGYDDLRARYEARLAEVLRALEAPPTAAPEAGTAERSPAGSGGPGGGDRVSVVGGPSRATGGRGRRLLVVAAVAAASIGAGLAVASAAGERDAGQEATGSVPLTTRERIAAAQRLVSEGDVLAAIKAFDAVIEDEPRNAVALANRGWLVRLAGRQGNDPRLVETGLAYVERAIAADPTYADAHFFRGMMLWQDRDDPAGAAAEFRLFLAAGPPEEAAAEVREALERAQAEADARAAGTAPGTTPASPGPPSQSPPP